MSEFASSRIRHQIIDLTLRLGSSAFQNPIQCGREFSHLTFITACLLRKHLINERFGASNSVNGLHLSPSLASLEQGIEYGPRLFIERIPQGYFSSFGHRINSPSAHSLILNSETLQSQIHLLFRDIR